MPDGSLDVRELRFRCALELEDFTAIYRASVQDGCYRLWTMELGTGSLYRASYGPAAQQGRIAVHQVPTYREFDPADFAFGDWACAWCGNDRFVHCCRCDLQYCGAKDMPRQGRKWSECPSCLTTGWVFSENRPMLGLDAVMAPAAVRLSSPVDRHRAPRRIEVASVSRSAFPAPGHAPRIAAAVRKLLGTGR